MSGPQATMNVRIGADIAPLQKGLKDGEDAIKRSAKVMGTAITSAAPTQSDGSTVAREFVRGLQAEFSQANTKLKAALFQGQLTPEQFRTEGQKAAQQFNAGITTGLEKFGAAGILTPELEASLVNRYKRAGLEAGEALSTGMIPSIEKSNLVLDSMERVGHRATGNLVMGLTMLSTSADGSASAISKVGHAIELAGFVLGGPEFGVPIAIGIQLIDQMVDAWDKSRKAAEDAAAAAVKSASDMANAMNIAGITNRLATIQQGTPTTIGADGKLIVNAPSAFAPGSFTGSLQDLEGRKQAAIAALQTANASQAAKLLNDIRQLNTLMAPMQGEALNLLRAGAAAALGTGSSGLGLPTGSNASGKAGVATTTAADPTKDLIATTNTLLGLKKAGADLPELNGRITQSYADLTNALARLDPYSEKALQTMTALAGADAAIQANARGIASTLTPNANAGAGLPAPGIISSVPTAPLPDSTIKAVEVHTAAVPGKLDELGGIIKDSIASQAQFIAQSLTTVLGVRNANMGGAIGSVLGGSIGGSLAGNLVGNVAGKVVAGTAGAALGGIVGSVVPVVGTVIGSIAGGAIGNAIGGLFGGGHKKAVDNSTSALNSLATAAAKVSEALSNVPEGFKVAYYRYEASAATRVPVYGGGDPSSGVVITGDLHFYGVQNIQQMYDELADVATVKGARGGSQRLSVALGAGRS